VAVAEAALKRAEHDSLSRQRVSDELRSMPTGVRSRRRLAWLSSNIVLNIIAASVISAYEETLTAVIAIAVFLPMVSDMSGCSGNHGSMDRWGQTRLIDPSRSMDHRSIESDPIDHRASR